MVKINLYNKLKDYDFEKLFKKLGYKYFTKGDYNLNIIGVRKSGTNVSNQFDDYLVIIYNNGTRANNRFVYSITTDPGITYVQKPITSKGTAILVPDQYVGAYKLGLHQGKYTALCQNKPVKVYRDNNKNKVYDLKPETIENGMFGINIHKAGSNSVQVDNWSAGCQVFAKRSDFDTFIGLCHRQIENKMGDTFTYTLLREEDLV